MKRDIISLIQSEYLQDSSGNGAPRLGYQNADMHKAWRGFDHPITARLLCPVNHLGRIKADPEGYVGQTP